MFLTISYDFKEVEDELRYFNLKINKIIENNGYLLSFINKKNLVDDDIRNMIIYSQAFKLIGYEIDNFDYNSDFNFNSINCIDLFNKVVKVCEKNNFSFNKFNVDLLFLDEVEKEKRKELRDEIQAIYHNLPDEDSKKFVYKDYEILLKAIFYNNKIYFVIDLSIFDLEKRLYKIFLTNQSLKASFHHLMNLKLKSMIKKYKPKVKNILNLFSSDGSFGIEYKIRNDDINFREMDSRFIFYEKFFENKELDFNPKKDKINDYDYFCVDDNMANLRNSEKNANILSITNLDFKRINLDWLDYKNEEDSYGSLISYLPLYAKANHKSYEKLMKNLFHQISYITCMNAPAIFLIKKEIFDEFLDFSINYGFDFLDVQEFTFGSMNLCLVSFVNKKKIIDED
jgi:hypothetical protein